MNLKFLLKGAPLFLIIFIDSMGLGLVFPIMTSLIMSSESHFLSANAPVFWRNFVYGFIVSIFMLCWFFGAAFLGDLSDKIGRKKSMLICLFGASFGYLISAIGVNFESISLLLLGRMIAGLTAGSQAIAQAAVVDISTEQERTQNIGLIIFFSSLGFVLGPLVGGFFSNNNIVSWFNFATPLYFAAFISFINIILLVWLYQEKFVPPVNTAKIKWHRAIDIFVSAFKNEKVRDMSVILFVAMLAWPSFYIYIGAYLLRDFEFSNMQISVYLSLLAIGFAIGTTALIRFFNAYFEPKKAVFYALIVCIICSFITFVSTNVILIWMSIIPLSAMMGVISTLIISIMSSQVSSEHQGWIMGVSNAVASLGFGLSGLIESFFLDIRVSIPILLAAVGFFMAAIMMLYFSRGSNANSQEMASKY